MLDEDVFDSVTWETPTANGYEVETPRVSGPGYRQSTAGAEGGGPNEPKWEGYLKTSVRDPLKELPDTKDAYVSYLVTAETNLPTFSSPSCSSRRRFQDFVFLRDNLTRDFPACVVPPLPDKHRLEYLTGDRFSAEFMERRRQELSRFLERLSRHPTLQRAILVRSFFESKEWTVKMHQHLSHPPGPEPAPSLLDNVSDALLNAFTRVRKPDERFLDMRDSVDKFEEGLANTDRVWNRARTRTNGTFDPYQIGSEVLTRGGSDLTADYHDLAVAVQGLGFLESGITDPLNHFSNTLLEFSAILRHTTVTSTDPYLVALHSLLSYSHANRAVLKLRDQKQLDFEELSAYLSAVTAERDRLAAVISGRAGSSGLGLAAYFRDRMDSITGRDDDRTRVERMKRLDSKIKELEEAVTTAHETSDAFSDETLREQAIFQHAKKAEMKEMLGQLADGQIEMYKASMEEWERIIPIIQRIRVDV
ncbi:nexin sorting protein [Gautieria morchelliformis]|nr:nexin sorting protein [Gautieria morchelliformis]